MKKLFFARFIIDKGTENGSTQVGACFLLFSLHISNVHGFSLYLQTPFAPPVAKSPSTRFTFLLNSSSVSCAIATCSSCTQVLLSVLCFHADPDPNLPFNATTDPDPSFTHVGKSEKNSTFLYSNSRQRHGCHNFQYFGQYIEIRLKWIEILIRQNYANPTGSGS